MKWLMKYFQEIKLNKLILWCYLIWYLVVITFYFDPTPKLWINAMGISGVIGTALVLSVSNSHSKIDYWQIFRLYLMPFCVSSFSSLIKDQGFIVIISPKPQETILAILSCVIFLLIIGAIKLATRAINQETS
ncbi:hypothetical protein H6F42_05945 [Pseudanabaena sp. FACHB-1998]|uniref:hypothetical protein n=1 Tax=Pseudanabaena sp. FACHB-1998 TaxID=2692858 RepID=UPI001680A670|nr:hypothetical protein [Pseudanabaena sp. FACHB-1998]MBD2176458.1 hypothetical protein [Pseudanabaena sp. FACHB-1998]